MALFDLNVEIYYHEKLLQTILEYKNDDGICKVSQAELAKRLGKNQGYVCKAIKRLNAEDNCIEMIKNGEYIIHYTNIRERGVFPKIHYMLTEKLANPEKYENNVKLCEKYNATKQTVSIFTGYLALICKE